MDKLKTRDIYLATYLKASGIPLESFERRHGQTFFIFQASEKADKLITKYIQDKATVNINVFRHEFKDLKNLTSGDFPVPKSMIE